MEEQRRRDQERLQEQGCADLKTFDDLCAADVRRCRDIQWIRQCFEPHGRNRRRLLRPTVFHFRRGTVMNTRWWMPAAIFAMDRTSPTTTYTEPNLPLRLPPVSRRMESSSVSRVLNISFTEVPEEEEPRKDSEIDESELDGGRR